MAPRRREIKVGLRREDAARDNLRQYGFKECVINEIINEQVLLYTEAGWEFMEEGGYAVLRDRCLERQKELADEEERQEMEQNAVDRREQVSSSSTLLVGCGAETVTPTSEAVMESSLATLQSGVTSPDYSYHSVRGTQSTRCGWPSSGEEDEDEETEPDEDCDSDDDEMIQLTPEPLCEELKELVRKINGQYKRKRAMNYEN